MSWSGELEPSSLAQVRRGRGKQTVVVEEDVLDVVKQIKQIDPRLHVRWSEAGEYFVVFAREEWQEEGSGYAVLYTPYLDGRVVKAIAEVAYKNRQPGYSYADELEKIEAKADAEQDRKMSEKIGESAEKLAWAIRNDLGQKSQIAVPKDIKK